MADGHLHGLHSFPASKLAHDLGSSGSYFISHLST
jgi:hypothetical protein